MGMSISLLSATDCLEECSVAHNCGLQSLGRMASVVALVWRPCLPLRLVVSGPLELLLDERAIEFAEKCRQRFERREG
jgi:hypothetical protein